MTDEVEAPEEQKVEQAPPEGGVSASEPENTEKADGPVEMPPDIQRRFNQMYRKSKDMERAVADLRDLNGALYAKLEELDQARANDHRQASEAQLTDAITKATQRGDWARVSQLQGQLIDLKAEAKARDVMAKAQPKKKEQPKQEVDHEMVAILQEWADELDETGNFRRPYAQPGHPKQKQAAALGQALMEDPSYGGDMSRILKELDRRMNEGRQQPAVLAPNAKPANVATKLSEDEIAAARRMGMDPAIYAKQKDILRQSGGAVRPADFARRT